MIRVFNLGGRRFHSPFNRNIVKRPSFKVDPVQIQESNKENVEPPRWIKLGRELSTVTGEDLGDFYLPFDTREHEPAIIIIGGSGSGKTTCLARIHTEVAFRYGRSQTIFDFKNQYRFVNEPNDNPKHVEILRAHGEEPKGVSGMKCYLPIHIVDRRGEAFCRDEYHYTNTWKMNINDCDAAGLLMLGQKDSEGRTYVNILDAAMAVVRRRDKKITMDTLREELESTAEEDKGSKRSVDSLLSMMSALKKTRVLDDDGNSILDLMHAPKRMGQSGEFFVFNLSGAGPNDIQTKGMLVNLINAICNNLITNRDIQPVLGIEEASAFFSKDSSEYLLAALNLLHYVLGRSLGIMRIYVYQNRKQVPPGLLDDVGVPILIETMNNFLLGNGEQLYGAGLAKVFVRHTSFMKNDAYLIRVLPPKCRVVS